MFDSPIDTAVPWLAHQKVTPRLRTPRNTPALAIIADRLQWAGWEQLPDRRTARLDCRPAGSRERRNQ
jgi:hypothetical protein